MWTQRDPSMQLETKFLRLRTPVTIGSRFDDWRVCWLGGWTRHRLTYLVMVEQVAAPLSMHCGLSKTP